MGFFRTINKAKGFLNKSVDKVSGFANKAIHVADKGLHLVGKGVDIANQVADKLTDVPIVGGIAGELKPVLGGSKILLDKGESALNKVNKVNNKFGKIRIK